MAPGPLSGVRVVELAGMGPAPFAAMMLAELGADVIKVDRPSAEALGPSPETNPLNRGRPSVMVDLKSPRGVQAVLRLVETADVFIEGFRPGVAERLGLGPDVLLSRRPQLVYGRMTGWGQEGPLAHTAGHDLTYLSVTGVLHAIGPSDAPAIPLNVVGDFGGGALYLVVGVLAALYDARESGQGQVVDAAIVDGVAHLATSIHGLLGAGLWRDEREHNLLDGGVPYYATYETSDGRHLAVAPLEPRFYADFERLLAPPERLPDRDDPKKWPALRTAIAARIKELTQQEWVDVFDGTDACVVPVVGLAEAAHHPHLAARGTLTHNGRGPVAAPAPRFSRTPTEPGTPARWPGEDTRAALERWGLEDVDGLLACGAVVQAEARENRAEEESA
ncbi:MAG: alpha-methylacyl-CoA racemase [Nocardioidaceae bacterium]|nr:alpha-methylacyl-CoA racemase [Nocardioidaceae bacterium]